jgi:hypothetical protein
MGLPVPLCGMVMGHVFQNDGKMALISAIPWENTIMVQHTGHIGNCMLRAGTRFLFVGNAKYLGERTYTTVTGARQSVPNYKLLWCEQ